MSVFGIGATCSQLGSNRINSSPRAEIRKWERRDMGLLKSRQGRVEISKTPVARPHNTVLLASCLVAVVNFKPSCGPLGLRGLVVLLSVLQRGKQHRQGAPTWGFCTPTGIPTRVHIMGPGR